MLNRHNGLADGRQVNQEILRKLEANTIEYAAVPELCFSYRLDPKKFIELAATSTQVATVSVGDPSGEEPGVYSIGFESPSGVEYGSVEYVVHEDTVEVGGTASDGNYDIIFASLTPPVRARVTRATTPSSNANIATALAAAINDLVATDLAGIVASASANSTTVTIVYEAGIAPQSLDVAESTATGTLTVTISSQIQDVADGLEALIEAARATFLAGVVDDESSDSVSITIDMALPEVVVVLDSPGDALTLDNAFTTEVELDRFPEDCWRDFPRLHVKVPADITINTILGDAGATNGLITNTAIGGSAGYFRTTGAAEYAPRYESAFVPLLTLESTEPLRNVTEGVIDVLIDYSPVNIGP